MNMKEVNETVDRILSALKREFSVDGEQEIADIVLIRSMSIFLGSMVGFKIEQLNDEGRNYLIMGLVKSVVSTILKTSCGECDLNINMHKKMH